MGNHLGGDAGATFGKTYWTLSHNIYSVNTIPHYALLFYTKTNRPALGLFLYKDSVLDLHRIISYEIVWIV